MKTMLNSMLANDIRQTLDHFQRSVDQLFDSGFSRLTGNTRALPENREWSFSPVLENAWSDHALHLRAIVPGVAQNDLKVTLNNNQLVIEGERKMPENWNRDSWTQLAYGKFYTAVTLPSGLDVDKLACRLKDGVLDIEIPVTESRRPRQVQIQIGEGDQQKSISA
jgi:HSP20 family protein